MAYNLEKGNVCMYVWVWVCVSVCVFVCMYVCRYLSWIGTFGRLWGILDGEKKQSRENILLSPPNFSFLNKTRNLCAVVDRNRSTLEPLFFFHNYCFVWTNLRITINVDGSYTSVQPLGLRLIFVYACELPYGSQKYFGKWTL